MFRKSMNEVGLPKELKFHCLRHSFATHVLQKGADIYGVSKIMGHSTPVVTAEFYDHSTALNYRGVTDLLWRNPLVLNCVIGWIASTFAVENYKIKIESEQFY